MSLYIARLVHHRSSCCNSCIFPNVMANSKFCGTNQLLTFLAVIKVQWPAPSVCTVSFLLPSLIASPRIENLWIGIYIFNVTQSSHWHWTYVSGYTASQMDRIWTSAGLLLHSIEVFMEVSTGSVCQALNTVMDGYCGWTMGQREDNNLYSVL